MPSPEHERQLPLDGHIQPPLFMHDHLHLVDGVWVEDEPAQPTTTDIARHIAQSVMGESPYHSYPTTLEDGVWDAVHRLEDENGLPDGMSAFDVYQAYLRVFHGQS